MEKVREDPLTVQPVDTSKAGRSDSERGPGPADVFVARQPILDRQQRIAAYELLFRDQASAGCATIDAPSKATARVAIDTFMTMGTSAVLGDRQGFINVDYEMLACEAIEALPADQIVLEVLEGVPHWARERCAELQHAGFRLALDDYVPGDSRSPMLGSADFVKVDLVLTPRDELASLVRHLRPSGAKLVAEKVESRDEFQRCLDLGFDFFQGYYFAKPTTLSARRQDPDHVALFQAFRALSGDTELGELENCFKGNARLGIQLLRLANSAGVGAGQRITTMQHAIMYLGRVQLRRWVLLMLYADGDQGRGGEALAEIAAVRGRMLELLLGSTETEDHVAKECGFLAGMLSLADALLGRDLAEVMTDLKIDPVIREAVVERRGPIASLLEIVECLEHGRFHMLAEYLAEVGITTEQLADAQSEAYAWIRSLYQGTGPTIQTG